VDLQRREGYRDPRGTGPSKGQTDASGTDLLRLQVADDGVDVVEDLVDEGHHLAHLDLDEVPPALLGDLDEGVARHVLHAVVRLWAAKNNRGALTSEQLGGGTFKSCRISGKKSTRGVQGTSGKKDTRESDREDLQRVARFRFTNRNVSLERILK